MAVFLERLTVPKLTPLATPVSQSLAVVPGTVTQLRLYVPPGPRGTVYLRLLHRGVQVLPARSGTWWRPDNANIPYLVNVPVAPGDEEFFLEGASPNAQYEHNIDFELTVRVADDGQTTGGGGSLLDRLVGLLD